MPDLEPDGVVCVHFLLHDHKLAGANLIHQPPVDVLLHHTPAQFLADGAQFLVRKARPGHANRGLPARVAGEGHRHTATRDLDALVAAKLVGDDFTLFDFEIDPAFAGFTGLAGLALLDAFLDNGVAEGGRRRRPRLR